MSAHTMPYGFTVTAPLGFDDAVRETKAALGNAGFGVLCTIDVATTMHHALGVEFPPYVILGACNPPLAYRALLAEPDIGLLLPCNVVVAATDRAMETRVMALDPSAALALTGNPALAPIADEATTRLHEALERVAAHGVAHADDVDEVDDGLADDIC